MAGSISGPKHTERKLITISHTQVIGYMLCKNARVYIALNKACPFLNKYTSILVIQMITEGLHNLQYHIIFLCGYITNVQLHY